MNLENSDSVDIVEANLLKEFSKRLSCTFGFVPQKPEPATDIDDLLECDTESSAINRLLAFEVAAFPELD